MFLAKSITLRAYYSRRFFNSSHLTAISPVERCWTSHSSGSIRQFCCTATAHAHTIEDEDHETGLTDYFALFGIPRRYGLDPKELQQSYRNLMAKYHPDRRNQQSKPKSGDDHDDDIDEEMDASQITHAYQTLREPHTRATYLLELVGRPLEETTNAASLVHPEFLMEVMEWRETIDSIDTSHHDDAVKELENLLSQTRNEIESVMHQLDGAFQDHNLDRAIQLSAQLQYWHRIEETIQDKM